MLRQPDNTDVHRTAVFAEHGRLNLYFGAVGLECRMHMVACGGLVAGSEENALSGVPVDEP